VAKVAKFTYRTLPLLIVLLLGTAGHASAQSLNVFFGVGSAHDSSTGQVPAGSLNGEVAPTLGGAFGIFGGNFMMNSHLGFGAEYAFRFTQGDYSGFGYRPTFYDFNAVYQPTDAWDRIKPTVEAGIGGATLHEYYNQQFCTIGCQNVSTLINNSNHFQLHVGVAARIYVKGHIFVRPAFDLHIVPNFNEFGSDFVPQYTVAVGYSFGGR